MATSGASLSDIYSRLSNAPTYHPFSVDTFSDWSMEAGDMITVSREGNSYQSPVHTFMLNWKGQPQISVSSNGNEKRENIAKQTKRKYNNGSSGYRNSGKNFKFEANMEHLLYEVDDPRGAFSRLEVNLDGLTHEVMDEDGRVSLLSNTVDGLYHEVSEPGGSVSILQNTVNGLSHEVYDPDGNVSILLNTAQGLSHEVYDSDGAFSLLENTVNGLYHEVNDSDGKVSILMNTADGLYHEVYDQGGLKTQVSTQSGIFNVLVTGTGANAKIKPAAIQAAIDAATGQSKINLSADHIILDGNTVASAITSLDIRVQGLTVDGEAIFNESIDTSSLTSAYSDLGEASCDSLEIDGNEVKVYDAKVSSDNETLTIYYTNGTTINFKKAATAKGTWSDGVFTVSKTSAAAGGVNLPISTSIAKHNESWSGKELSVTIGYEDPISGRTISTGKVINVSAPITAECTAMVWDSTNKKFYNYGRALVNGTVVETSEKRESNELRMSFGARTYTGSIVNIPVSVLHGSNTILSETPAVSVRADTSAISWDSTNKYFFNYGYAYLDGRSTNSAKSDMRTSSQLSLSTGNWSSGSRTVKVNFGSKSILSETIYTGASASYIKHGVTIADVTGTYGIIASPYLVKAGRNDGEALQTLAGDQYIRAYCVNPDGQGQYDSTVWYVNPDVAQVTISAPQGTAIRDGKTNNQYGYAILNSVTDANQRKAGIGVRFDLLDKNSKTISTLTSYLEWAPTNLYKKGYQDGLNTGIGYEAYQGFGFITSTISSPDATLSRAGFRNTRNKGFKVTTVGKTYYFKFSD